MDSDSDFYGDEETISRLKARVDDFNAETWWKSHNDVTSHAFREDFEKQPGKGHLHNKFEGRIGAWQLNESIDSFLARLPPATTNRTPGFDWIWVANPFIPGESSGAVAAFKQGGEERLRMLSKFIAMSNASGKTPFVAKRGISKEREETVQDLRDLAIACNVLSGKWMLFPEPGNVNEVWGKVARATANNELGTAAKVETRVESEKERLICIYTRDFRDKGDIARVLNRMRELEFVRPSGKQIYYKCDAWTEIGIYGGNEWDIPASMYSSNEVFLYIKDNFVLRRM
ncbi:hypothetical protein B0T26DRAFT_649950 [Lasiosphaeria miniovina]|uniref:DUF1917-domain-containing protein n=1 Tax=Lasiosphaeria miniovina TaxID=1954250 RepID=A0AA40DSG9_9PEZI|nr:uncharacterized protein B0T26DRAFT_649950 [Lasiosphaeria miniovina]KAK0713840.1 hypothetical protein B0T26DRAFT_649950 [Lasiosphaeria miniovina]